MFLDQILMHKPQHTLLALADQGLALVLLDMMDEEILVLRDFASIHTLQTHDPQAEGTLQLVRQLVNLK